MLAHDVKVILTISHILVNAGKTRSTKHYQNGFQNSSVIENKGYLRMSHAVKPFI